MIPDHVLCSCMCARAFGTAGPHFHGMSCGQVSTTICHAGANETGEGAPQQQQRKGTLPSGSSVLHSSITCALLSFSCHAGQLAAQQARYGRRGAAIVSVGLENAAKPTPARPQSRMPEPAHASVPVAEDARQVSEEDTAAATAQAPLPEGVVVRNGRQMTKVQPMADVHRDQMHVAPPALVQLWSDADFVQEVCHLPAHPTCAPTTRCC